MRTASRAGRPHEHHELLPPRRPTVSPSRMTPAIRSATPGSTPSPSEGAEAVVGGLEAVEVDEHRRRLDAVAAGVGEHLARPFHDRRRFGRTVKASCGA